MGEVSSYRAACLCCPQDPDRPSVPQLARPAMRLIWIEMLCCPLSSHSRPFHHRLRIMRLTALLKNFGLLTGLSLEFVCLVLGDIVAIGRCYTTSRDCNGIYQTVKGNRRGASSITSSCTSFITFHPLQEACSVSDCSQGCERKYWAGADCVALSGTREVKCVITT
ncbi:hypothetical protein BDZ90DRAFT_23177 [Jaminaea rosea]|uniref:Uncharacterized protein n=1 Tax=Jaminaea rosea TaxID=1569628 RepID=A0A316UZN1_9BASI|nr:hypothetical protein BDZ90DRAFT_23177 [Jaminaea rosea]PWN30760.1 hypothetical protein BDZ90DRAFT_23177 [Jaminaea rosea]